MAVFTPDEIKKFKAQVDAASFVAERRLNDKESVQYDKYTPTNWYQKLPIIPQEETPPKSGYGYTQSPYISQWTKMWGVNPITDLPKYRTIYRNVAIVKKAIDKTVATAISKGFELELGKDVENREEILDFVKDWLSQQEDFNLHLQMLASDALVYGNAFAEIVYDDIDMELSHSNDPEFHRVEIPNTHEDYRIGENGIPYMPTQMYNGDGKYINVKAKGNPIWLKPLDPLWMRVRRDSYGNVYGYLQYLSTPPVAFTNEKIIHIRFNAKSWWTENAYGTSALMALIRTQEAIWTIENDLILISHACAKPPLIFACGKNPDGTIEDWTEAQLTRFVADTNSRGPGGDIYHRGDVESKPLPFPASSLAPLLAHLDYHAEQRMILLGVPPDLLGISGGSNRSTAMVTMDDWINTIQLLQEQVADAIEEQLFKYLVEKRFGEGTPVPEIVWNQIYEKDHSAEVNKIMSLRAAGIITINEARKWMEEIGKKLQPIEGGDTLLGPQTQEPQKEEMPPEDSILEDDELEAEPMKAEYTQFKKKPVVLQAIDGFSEPGTPSGTGLKPQLMYPLLKKRKIKSEDYKAIEAIAKQEYSPESMGQSNPKLRADYGDIDSGGDYAKFSNPKIRKIGNIDGISFWLVSGDKVAELHNPEWKNTSIITEHEYIGGHHLVFDFIPENEIWISDLDTTPEKTSLHEMVEYNLMKEGKTYAEAHKEALKAEGNKTEAEQMQLEYIKPKQVEEKISTIYPKLSEKENEWKVDDNKTICFDEHTGIIKLLEDGKETDKVLVRSTEDIDKFLRKQKTGEKRNDIG